MLSWGMFEGISSITFLKAKSLLGGQTWGLGPRPSVVCSSKVYSVNWSQFRHEAFHWASQFGTGSVHGYIVAICTAKGSSIK